MRLSYRFKGARCDWDLTEGVVYAVRGANGSGKTTLLDALAWLFVARDTRGRAEFARQSRADTSAETWVRLEVGGATYERREMARLDRSGRVLGYTQEVSGVQRTPTPIALATMLPQVAIETWTAAQLRAMLADIADPSGALTSRLDAATLAARNASGAARAAKGDIEQLTASARALESVRDWIRSDGRAGLCEAGLAAIERCGEELDRRLEGIESRIADARSQYALATQLAIAAESDIAEASVDLGNAIQRHRWTSGLSWSFSRRTLSDDEEMTCEPSVDGVQWKAANQASRAIAAADLGATLRRRHGLEWLPLLVDDASLVQQWPHDIFSGLTVFAAYVTDGPLRVDMTCPRYQRLGE